VWAAVDADGVLKEEQVALKTQNDVVVRFPFVVVALVTVRVRVVVQVVSPLSSRSLLWSLEILVSGGGLHVRRWQASRGPTVIKTHTGCVERRGDFP
jgi:hypothetical protein